MLSFPAVSNAAQFFEALYDVPILMDLKEVPDSAVIFDKPSGRIAQVVASSLQGRQEVADAYEAALSQMGWVVVTEGKYRRDNEVLEISVTKSDSSKGEALFIEFSLNPLEE